MTKIEEMARAVYTEQAKRDAGKGTFAPEGHPDTPDGSPPPDFAAIAAREYRRLVDLSREHRERGENMLAITYGEAALRMPLKPADDHEARQEVAIAGYYCGPASRERAGRLCNELALERDIPATVRSLAFSNLHFYLRPLEEHCPSWRTHRIAFTPDAGWLQQNVSITRWRDRFMLLQRTHNYTPIVDGVVRFRPPAGDVIRTRNFLLELDDDLEIVDGDEIHSPADWPCPPAYDQVIGWEDMRLFVVGDKLMTVANVRELNREGWCQFVRAEIRDGELIHEGVISQQPPVRHEKNWMPIEDGGGRLIYLCDPGRVVDINGRTIPWKPAGYISPPGQSLEYRPPIYAATFRGGSQAVQFESVHRGTDGGIVGERHLLALVHEAEWRGPLLYYRHRWALFDRDGRLLRCSPPWYFQHQGLEYCAGLTWHPDGRLIVSHGCHEAESWLGTVDPAEVARMLGV